MGFYIYKGYIGTIINFKLENNNCKKIVVLLGVNVL